MILENALEKCNLCPHKCNVNRINGEIGRCKAGKNVKIALANLHFYEEPSISGENGSGTVFFTGCNLSCKFCQNYKISQEQLGKEIEIEELANEFLRLQNLNANNINLVTGVMYIPQIIEAIKIAKKNGLNIPIVYNSSGYENAEAIKLLDGYIDVYLPDLKYYDNELGFRLSGIKEYFENATSAIEEMYKQVGNPKFDENGLIKKGVIIRHLVLPNHLENSKKVFSWIKEKFDKNVLVSVMAQYFPSNKANLENDINRKLNQEEYDEIENYIFDLDIDGYMQDLEENEEKYVPDFDGKNR
ncbi:MAG: radical SAM protein [Clostridia bacterium]|nr:radical SAM protein [Clostridia bacterium]